MALKVVLQLESAHGHQADVKTTLSKCCLGKVQASLQSVPGVEAVSPASDLSLGSALQVTVSSGSYVTLGALADAVSDVGQYVCTAPGVHEHLLQISGLRANDVQQPRRIVHRLMGLKGVLNAAVKPGSTVAVVWCAPDDDITLPISRLSEAIRGDGTLDQLVSQVFSAVASSGSMSDLHAEPKAGPNERELTLLLAGFSGKPLPASLFTKLEAVTGVVSVEEVPMEDGGDPDGLKEVRVFYVAQNPVSLEALQTTAIKVGAKGAEVTNMAHALEGLAFGEAAEQMHGEISKIVISVRGMSSKRCTSVVKQSLEKVPGVTGVAFPGPEPSGTCPTELHGDRRSSRQVEERKVLVSVEAGSNVTADMLRDAVERWTPPCCGRMQPTIPGASQILVSLRGVDTKAKAQSLSAILAELPGVVFESISIADQEALIIGHPSLTRVLKALELAGYSAEVNEVISKPLPTSTASAAAAHSTAKVVLSVGGMTCSACSNAVEQALQALPGVSSAQVNLLTEKATVHYDKETISVAQIVEEVEDIGYEPSVLEEADASEGSTIVSARLAIGDMSCTSCSSAVESVLQAQLGVESASVNFAIGKATVKFDSSKTGLRSLVEAVEDAGYSACPESWSLGPKAGGSSAISEARKWAILFGWALLCALPIATITMGLHHLHIGNDYLMKEVVSGLSVQNLICLALSTLAQFGPPGLKFYRDAMHGMGRCAPNMALLVTLGTSVSYAYGIYGIVLGLHNKAASAWPDDYFEVSADLIAFITLGKWLEARAKGATSRVLHKLLELKPQTATLLTLDNSGAVVSEKEIPAEQLQTGDMLKVVRGASVPSDGVIVVGTTEVDESMLTGESMPVSKSVGDTILGATVIREGTIFIRVSSTGSDTVLSQIVRMIEDAQASKPPIQALADAISRVFVPTIVLISTLVFCGWLVAANLGVVPQEWMHDRSPLAFALNLGIATMVVACPCAMGLAVPTAVMVGTGVAARHGVLIKDGDAIEHARKVTAVIFDKTGTLTEGKPQVTDVLPLGNKLPVEEIVRLTGAAETSSEHPLGRALVMHGQSSTGQSFLGAPTDFSAESGKGLRCQVDGRHITVGTRSWMQENKVKGLTLEVLAATAQLEGEAKTAVMVAIDLEMAAVFGIADAPRAESPAVLKKLQQMGIQTWMVTGDNRRTANSVADKLGLSSEYVMAEVMPGNKARQVRVLQEQGAVVAMVGDGINDAPALAQADLGLAIGSGTDIAIEAAGMVLMGENISGVVTAIDVSRSINRRIWTNFGWAFVYNLVLIPAASGAAFPFIGATLPAWAAGAAMAMSSVSVVTSSLLLNMYSAPAVSRDAATDKSKLKSLREVIVSGSGEDTLAEPLLSGD